MLAPNYTSSGLVEFVASLGFDAIFIDTEHGTAGWAEVEDMVRAAESYGATPIVRVQSNDPSTIARALDRGAGGIQVPHVNTASEAHAVVQAAKFAPVGHRGIGGGRTAYGRQLHEYTQQANDETAIVVMLEEVEALDNLDAILAIDHIDAFFVASGDLSQSMGFPGEVGHPKVQAAIDRAIQRIREKGRAPGVVTTPATVQRYRDLGALLLYVSLGDLFSPSAKDFLSRVNGT
jgi:4-hydroxy-2-oxoheptanedioate aldolase